MTKSRALAIARTTIWASFAVGLVLTLGSVAQATTLWGVTNGTGDGGFWTGGEIFTVDTSDGTVVVKWSYNPTDDGLLAFGDIAVRANGEVYVTYYGDAAFDKLAQVNTSTGALSLVMDLGGFYPDGDGIAQVNALDFIGDTLYGVTGGGIAANLLQFDLSSPSAVSLGSLGINSDGDLADHPSTGTTYYTSWETGSTSELSTITWSPVGKTNTKEIATSSGWAGLEFTSDGTLYAGTYRDEKLYTLDYATGSSTHTATMAWDLSPDLGGTITGLSRVPEPTTALLLAAGLAGLAAMGRLRSHH